MERQDQNALMIAALAGLLHDLGKLPQRANATETPHTTLGAALLDDGGPLAHLIPAGWRAQVATAVAQHHADDAATPLARALRVADRLAGSEPVSGQYDPGKLATTSLIPIASQVSLAEGARSEPWQFKGADLSADTVPFPEPDASVTPDDYRKLWEVQLFPQLRDFPGPVDGHVRLAGLLDILAGATQYIPAMTPWEDAAADRAPADVPLIQHLHLTAALTACLLRLPANQLDALDVAGRDLVNQTTPIARLLKLDFSGIQSFIYRITEPADARTFRHTAKRLRGRSLALALLNRALGDWLLQRLDLPPTHILYAGGGVIELLLPVDAVTDARLSDALSRLEAAMLHEFEGALGVIHAEVPLTPGDFGNVRQARVALAEGIGAAKTRKWSAQMDAAFFTPRAMYHTCAVCDLMPVNEPNDICPQCLAHHGLGEKLPHAVALATSATLPGATGAQLPLPGTLEGLLALVSTDEAMHMLAHATQPVFVQGRNRLFHARTWPAGSAPGRWEIANAAPLGPDGVFDFEQIADCSQGTPLLGILKADADRMGLLFSHGLHPPTFARAAALSQTVHRFFGVYLNQLARELTATWRANLDETMRQTLKRRGVNYEQLDSLFYVVYAGGDDLFVIGPWDQMIEFALALRRAYRAYTCEQADFSLSGGLVFVKPHFPIHQFARLVDEAEGQAKDAGRDRLTLFGQPLVWAEAEALIALGKRWAAMIQAGQMPRSLIHDLGRMQQTSATLFTPTLYYTLARRLSQMGKTDVQALGQEIIGILPHLTVPVSYTSLITRKE